MTEEAQDFLRKLEAGQTIGPAGFGRLYQIAHELRRDSPLESLELLKAGARAVALIGIAPIKVRLGFWIDASEVGWEAGSPDAYYDEGAAQVCAEVGDYLMAGHYYHKAVRAAKKVHQTGGSQNEAFWRALERRLLKAESNYTLAGHATGAASVRYERLCLQRDNDPSLWARFRSWVLWALWGWGERPLHVAVSACCLIIVCAVGYRMLGVLPAAGNTPAGFGNCLYLSVVTFTTLGYGDYLPANTGTKLLAGSEAMAGILFTGMFLVSFVKKYSG